MRPINYDAITAMKKCIQENMVSGKTSLTLRSIAEQTGVPFQTVGRYIKQFIDSGEIKLDEEYGYVLTEMAGKINRVRGVPLVGNISCGSLNIAEEDITDYIKIPEKLIADGEYFLLRAQGDSMINIGIESRQNARSMEVAQEFPAEFKVKFVVELAGPLENGLGLFVKVFFAVKTGFHKTPLRSVGSALIRGRFAVPLQISGT